MILVSPGDPLPAPPFAIAGRVVDVSANRAAIADAYAMVSVRVEGASLLVGDLVVATIGDREDDVLIARDVRVIGQDVRDD